MTFSLSKLVSAKIVIGLSSTLVVAACTYPPTDESVQNPTPNLTQKIALNPADKFDLSLWRITLPADEDNDGSIDSVDVKDLQSYSHPDYFYLDENQHMVFTTPNKAVTTANSSNTRSELRHMSRGTNSRIKTAAPGNNFALAAHQNAAEFAAVGGKMDATLKVNHVALNAKNPEKYPAFSVVVGQIHAGKDKQPHEGFGYGNEPLKIFYKKWPNHETGSVFWTYEKNLAKEDPNRHDVAYPVWGNGWDNPEAPGDSGIALDEEFSYSVNVVDNIMYLSFESANQPTVKHQIDLSNNIDAYGNPNTTDHPRGYSGDWMYFKAGAYSQCSVNDAPGFWYPGCAGTGNWQTDAENGDYARVTFSKLVLSPAENPIN